MFEVCMPYFSESGVFVGAVMFVIFEESGEYYGGGAKSLL